MLATQQTTSAVVLDHLCAAISSVEVCSRPYCHFYLDKAFPDEVFNRMLELLPDSQYYAADNPRIHTRDDGLVTRNILSLSEAALAPLPEPARSFWSEIAAALMSMRLRQIVFARLSQDLSRRFRLAPDRLDSVPAYPKPALVKDFFC